MEGFERSGVGVSRGREGCLFAGGGGRLSHCLFGVLPVFRCVNYKLQRAMEGFERSGIGVSRGGGRLSLCRGGGGCLVASYIEGSIVLKYFYVNGSKIFEDYFFFFTDGSIEGGRHDGCYRVEKFPPFCECRGGQRGDRRYKMFISSKFYV